MSDHSEPKANRVDAGPRHCRAVGVDGLQARGAGIAQSVYLRTDDGATRLAYRRDPETALRRFILVGTSWLNDTECLDQLIRAATRRFVPIQCGEGSHVEPYLDKHRDQLWAEGLARYEKGERANLPRDFMDLQPANNGDEAAAQGSQSVEDAMANLSSAKGR